ncbi:hypothetical protein MRB53_040382 [Persea americana]|nr:hypothetical protein MRB53_040382 [Persea americana]
MRNEAKIHVVRCDKTVEELRDAELAQQNHRASRGGDLFGIAAEAVRNHFQPKAGQKRYVSVLLLDAHWDSQAKLIRGHAALGGGDGEVQLAIFGSHALQSYPTCLEEVPLAFTDCTRTDTAFVANDCNESGSNWEAANIGIGAHLHETGHLFGCPHQESGVMLRDYTRLNRTFTCREPFSTRTKEPGQRLCLPLDECAWHRLDCLRFRFHPCFRLPTDPTIGTDDSVQVWPVDNGNILITAPSGVAFIELFTEGDELCKAHIEYVDTNGFGNLPRQIVVTESELRERLSSDRQKKKLRLEIHSAGQGKRCGWRTSRSSRPRRRDSSCRMAQWPSAAAALATRRWKGSQPEEVAAQERLQLQDAAHGRPHLPRLRARRDRVCLRGRDDADVRQARRHAGRKRVPARHAEGRDTRSFRLEATASPASLAHAHNGLMASPSSSPAEV